MESTEDLAIPAQVPVPRDVPVSLDDTELTKGQKTQVWEFLKKYSHTFAFSKFELGTAEGVKHHMWLTNDQPVKDRTIIIIIIIIIK